MPQGSVLGPLLFLLFVNDVPEWILCSIKMFADDTKIWTSIKSRSVASTLQRDLNKLIEWSQKWLLSFNPAKCKVMSIGHKIDTEYEMKIDGKVWNLEKVTEERDLGVCNGIVISSQETNAKRQPQRQCQYWE